MGSFSELMHSGGENQTFIFQLLFNLLVAFIGIRLIYFPKSKQKAYLFTFFLFNTTTFLICFLLRKVPIEMGFALGLFAVFGILRYRTETIPIKEMTYLFVVIGLAMINALSFETASIFQIIAANGILLFMTLIIEQIWFAKTQLSQEVIYDNLAHLKPENRDALIENLQQKIGGEILAVKVLQTDFLKETALLQVSYTQE